MRVEATVNQRDFRSLHKWARKQARWAATVALTKTADHSRNRLQAQIPQKFDTTKKWWRKNSPTGLKIKAARRNTLTSEVFTGPKNHWLARHVYGDSRKPERKMLIIPVYKKSGNSPDKADRRFAGFKPATWRKARGRKVAREKYGAPSHGVARDVKGRYPVVIHSKSGDTFIKRGKGQKFQPIFSESRKTKPMKKRMDFYKSIKHDVHSRGVFQRYFLEELAKALRGSR